MTTYYCAQCKVRHVRIHQAVPDKPVGYHWSLAADLFVVLLVIGSVLLWMWGQA